MDIFGLHIERAAPVEKAAAPKAKQRPLGIVGMHTASGKVEEEFLTQLQWPDAGKVYQEMASNDAVVGGCLYVIETLARRADWHVEPASQEAGDIEAAEFLESCMHDMTNQAWDDFICDALSMLTYGFSFHEIVYKIRRGPQEKDPKFKSNYTDGRIGWQCLPIRSQASLDEWEINQDTGEIISFIQDPSIVGLSAQKVNIPIEGNLLFKTRANRGNPEGWSLLRRAYRSWFFKRYIEELEGIGIERGLAGIPVLSPPPDVPLFDKDNEEMVQMLGWAQELVAGLRQDKEHGIILPNTDWKLELLGTSGAKQSLDTDTIIRRHEYRIASSMLSDLILIGADATGSFSLAETKQSMLVSSLQAIIGTIAATLNMQAVPALFQLNNWQLERLPRIVASNIEQPSPSDVALILRSLKVDVAQSPKLLNYLLQMIQAPELTEDEYAEFINQQSVGNTGNTDNTGDAGATGDAAYQDTTENDLKQSDKLTR